MFHEAVVDEEKLPEAFLPRALRGAQKAVDLDDGCLHVDGEQVFVYR